MVCMCHHAWHQAGLGWEGQESIQAEKALGWEDCLEKGLATHPRILTWRIPWTEQPGYTSLPVAP